MEIVSTLFFYARTSVRRHRRSMGHHLFGPETLRWVLGVSFIATAARTLITDKLDEKLGITTLLGAGARFGF